MSRTIRHDLEDLRLADALLLTAQTLRKQSPGVQLHIVLPTADPHNYGRRMRAGELFGLPLFIDPFMPPETQFLIEEHR